MKSDNKILNLISYFALIIIAFLLLITRILPMIGLDVKGTLINLISTIQNVLILIVISVNAYYFASTSKKWIKILFWVAIAVFIFATVVIWI